VTREFTAALSAYLSQQRWFAGKGTESQVTDILRLPWLSEQEPYVRVELVTVPRAETTVVYQVPLSYHAVEQPELQHAYVGVLEDPVHGRLHAYDALHDRAAVTVLLQGFRTGESAGGLIHRATGPVDLAADTPSLLLTGEQSNSSLLLGEDLLLKVFRTLDAGRNPDIEVLAALARTGSTTVAPLRGWIETDHASSGRYDLAMLQDFLRTGTDGWQYARASVRDLMAEADLYADEVGGDFAGEAERLGATVARLHADLAVVLPTARWGRPELAVLVERLQRRLTEAAGLLPEIGEHAATLSRFFAELSELSEVAVQRVHGDLHLGQSLRTVDGWRIIDFEGEPAKPLAERTALDSPLRDVAGMLRSFDYAANSVALPGEQDNQQAHRAQEWALRNQEAFRTGYAAESGQDAGASSTLLRAYEVDKAVYEAVYEKHNRPSWLPIPMAAVRRLAREGAP